MSRGPDRCVVQPQRGLEATPSRAMCVRRALVLAAALSFGCTLPLADKPCPCAEGYHCVVAEDRCAEGPAPSGMDASIDGGLDAAPPPVDAGEDAGSRDAGGDASLPEDAFVPEDTGPMDTGPMDTGPDDALLAYFPCEDIVSSALPDRSGNGRDANCDGAGCPLIVDGVVGMACDFTSEARRARLGYDPVFVPGRAGPPRLSVALWIFPRAASGSAIGVPTGTGIRNAWQAYVGPSSVGLHRLTYVTWEGDAGPDHMYAAPMALGAWVHVVLTYDGDVKELWIDGARADVSTGHALVAELNRSVFIGADENGLGELDLPLDGILDEIRIYGRVLSPAEIGALYAERE